MIFLWIFLGLVGLCILMLVIGVIVGPKKKKKQAAESKPLKTEFKTEKEAEEGKSAVRDRVFSAAGKVNERISAWLAQQSLDETADPDFAEVVRLREARGQAFADAVERCRQKNCPAMAEYFALETLRNEWLLVISDELDPPGKEWSLPEMAELRRSYNAAKDFFVTEEMRCVLGKTLPEKRADVQAFIARIRERLAGISPEAAELARQHMKIDGVAVHRKGIPGLVWILREGNRLLLSTEITGWQIKEILTALDALQNACEQESEQALDNAICKNWYECEKREKELQSRLPAGGAVRAKVLSVEDVLYFEVGVAQTISVPSLFPSGPKKPSMLGTAMNEALFGSAAATAKAMYEMQKSANASSVSEKVEKEATIYFSYESGQEPLSVFESGIKDLQRMLPEKKR